MLLLRSLIVFMEEHITMELHEVMRSLLKTIGDPDIGKGMCENASLLGRFVDPEAYVPLIVPRIRGDDDAEFTQVSTHTHTHTAEPTLLDLEHPLLDLDAEPLRF